MSHDDNLIEIHNGIPMVSSLEIAERFAREHKNVLASIRALECSEKFNRLNFQPIEYVDRLGRKMPMVWMTRDGFAMLVMGFTSKDAMIWKERFLEAFNLLESRVLESAVRDIGGAQISIPSSEAELVNVVHGLVKAYVQERITPIEADLEAQRRHAESETARAALEHARAENLLVERTKVISDMRAAERARDLALRKLEAVAKHAYKAMKDAAEELEADQNDLMARNEASNVLPLMQVRRPVDPSS